VLATIVAGRPAAAEPSAPIPADAQTILRAVRQPGASAVMVNVWATWCDPCREEMPALLRFYRKHAKRGLRLVLVSADDPENRNAATRFLAAKGVDFPTWIKQGDDMAFIDALDPRWSGNLPVTLFFDSKGTQRARIDGAADEAALESAWLRTVRTQPHSKTGSKP